MNQKVKIALIGIALVLVFVPAVVRIALSSGGDGASAGTIAQSIAGMLKGDVTGEIGHEYKTRWFNFTVHSIDRVSEYAGYEPDEGNILLDVVVEEFCTFENSIEMGTFDFFMDADSFDEYAYPLNPLDDTMMPEEFKLGPKERKKYHMVYEAPSDAKGVKLIYKEIDEEENTHATFTINIKDA
ncbi:MAG: hypothetical protein LBT23_10680 [Synergistaceae bacterium]|jgi:hypothetical protein|nr:hypothetical protein [Synergistaceae bacterium]